MTKWGSMLPNGRNSMNMSVADIRFAKGIRSLTNEQMLDKWKRSRYNKRSIPTVFKLNLA